MILEERGVLLIDESGDSFNLPNNETVLKLLAIGLQQFQQFRVQAPIRTTVAM